MKISGAQAVLKSLIHEGVSVLFGYPGGTVLPIYDSMSEVQDQLHHVLVRHEQGAAFAAGGYARASGKVGVCIASSGPGATNLITGIADAMADSIPLICIAGQVPSEFLGTNFFQEVDIISMTSAITKWNYQITDASEIPKIFAKAFHVAQDGRPGPVLISITKNAQFELLEYEYGKYVQKRKMFKNGILDFFRIKKAARLINQAKRPYLLLGHGGLISHAEEEIFQLATQADIPVASTLLGLSLFPEKHPLYVGMLGMYGNYAANLLTNQADLIIAVGMRFDYRVTGNLAKYAKQSKVIHIDIDSNEVDRHVYADVKLRGDAKETLKNLLPHIKTNNHKAWISEFCHLYKVEYKAVIQDEIHPRQSDIKMAEVVFLLSKKTQGKSVIVTDVGFHQMAVARYYEFTESNSHITSGGLGAMGFALPAAIGVQFANPKKPVIAIIGDGGFQMNMQELGTITQENLPIKIMILNNRHLGIVKQQQTSSLEEDFSFVKLKNPDFIKMAESYGISSFQVKDRSQLAQGLDEMLKSEHSFLLEVICEEEENIFPIIPEGGGVEDVLLR
jgi:acetolactate synthase-1/2/3 large subunit